MRHKHQWLVFPAVLACVALVLVGLALVSTSKPSRKNVVLVQPKIAQPKIAKAPVSKVERTIVGSMVNAVTDVVTGAPSLTVESCRYHVDLSYKYSFRGSWVYVFETQITNHSSTAVDELFLYVRCKEVDRTVPIAESIERVEIPGGIEHLETRAVYCDVPVSSFNARRNNEPIEVAVVSGYCPVGKKPYQHFNDKKMTVADYINRQDPALLELLNAE